MQSVGGAVDAIITSSCVSIRHRGTLLLYLLLFEHFIVIFLIYIFLLYLTLLDHAIFISGALTPCYFYSCMTLSRLFILYLTICYFTSDSMTSFYF